jgi:hypothetical protein
MIEQRRLALKAAGSGAVVNAKYFNASKPEIAKGTVVEADGFPQPGPQWAGRMAPAFRLSSAPASKAVVGTFQGWDSDDPDIAIIHSYGPSVVLVKAGQSVSAGSLLESNGDGTARVQADDIVRASTIARVTHAGHMEDFQDGTFTVCCNLY